MNIGNSKVTINGVWPSQNQNILSFENPCLTEVELESSTIIAKQKDYSGKLNLCFVGRLEPAKGALIILELLQNLEDVDWVDTFYIIGDGPSKNIIENKKLNLHLKVCLTGWLLREQLNEIYTKCHLIILPSYASEGFPKVLAEAASYGCVPIVSNLSSISQYINKMYDDEDLNLGLQMEQPLTNKGLDFVCYNECKDRNDPTYCRQKCLNQ